MSAFDDVMAKTKMFIASSHLRRQRDLAVELTGVGVTV